MNENEIIKEKINKAMEECENVEHTWDIINQNWVNDNYSLDKVWQSQRENLYHNPEPSDANKENSHKRIKVQREKAKKVQYKEHEDDDFDDFEGSDNEVTEDICIICGEFGNNNEMWIRCVMCGQWAHQACSVDGKGTYVCDFCI
ncbi:hypothetical protein RN001_004109 [Aquatica leii]|uniref:Zinc finger PHD-type domain-containing protein n=1 Tax=Aquatica leii TaxID=1421715 RepID=A0AAN7QPG3_9COLE|nr:hypothetical protein RN001_004109 [Aquatica leii]